MYDTLLDTFISALQVGEGEVMGSLMRKWGVYRTVH
jgi:hypothetical protein